MEERERRKDAWRWRLKKSITKTPNQVRTTKPDIVPPRVLSYFLMRLEFFLQLSSAGGETGQRGIA